MKKRFQILPTLTVALAGWMLSGPALAKPLLLDEEQAYQRNLVETALSGKSGAFEVSRLLAKCHGFQSEIYNRGTRTVEMRGDDLKFYQKVSRQSLRSGFIAFLLIIDHKAGSGREKVQNAAAYVDKISNASREQWKPKLAEVPNTLGPDVWAELHQCNRLEPVTDYIISILPENLD